MNELKQSNRICLRSKTASKSLQRRNQMQLWQKEHYITPWRWFKLN